MRCPDLQKDVRSLAANRVRSDLPRQGLVPIDLLTSAVLEGAVVTFGNSELKMQSKGFASR